MALIISNTGDGDPPDNATRFWAWINGPLDGTPLAATHIALLGKLLMQVCNALGLGDSDYANFNNTGKMLAKRLPALGASWLIPPAFCDAQDGYIRVPRGRLDAVEMSSFLCPGWDSYGRYWAS